jgi:hypothetical protein
MIHYINDNEVYYHYHYMDNHNLSVMNKHKIHKLDKEKLMKVIRRMNEINLNKINVLLYVKALLLI